MTLSYTHLHRKSAITHAAPVDQELARINA